MDGFADLLTDAFSESSVPSFVDGDLDFESLGFEEKNEEDKTENSITKTDKALLQEVTGESEALLGKATTDDEDKDSTGSKSDDEEFARNELEDSSTSSESTRSSSGEEPGDLLMSVCCSDNPYSAQIQIEGRIFAEGQPTATEGADSPTDRNEEQGEADEEVSCFEGILECGDETVMMEEAEETSGDESSDSDHEDMTVEQEENVLPQKTENPYKISLMAEDNLEFPCLSLQNLITEVDGEERVKMTNFTGDEHQEAGEAIADYPSDFSSDEFTRAELNASPLLKQEHGAAAGTLWIGGTEDSGYDKDDGFLYSTDLEMNVDRITSLDGAAGEVREHLLAAMDESSSSSSSDDEETLRRTRDELFSVRDVENNTKPEDVQLHEFSRWSSSDVTIKARSDPADFIRSGFGTFSMDEYLLTTVDADETEDSLSDYNQCPAEDMNCYSVEHRGTTSSSNQGSIDDSFFFDTDSSKVTEQPVNDEDEEKRNAEQMQERINAFERFYDNGDNENERMEREIKVQFCADPLSQVNYYETDSSDRESLSSSTDTEEDLSSEELREPEDLLREPEDLLREPEDLLREPEDLLREREDLLREPEDLLREPEDLLREREDLLREPEDQLREPKNITEPEDQLRESEDMMEPEDLIKEHKDTLREFEGTPEIPPMCDAPNPKQPQSESEVGDTQTSTKTYKGVSKLKLMLKLCVVTMTGLLFWLITDQPEWLRDLFSV